MVVDEDIPQEHDQHHKHLLLELEETKNQLNRSEDEYEYMSGTTQNNDK
jgi:hypothetical protein